MPGRFRLVFKVDGTPYAMIPKPVWEEGDRLQYRVDIFDPASINALFGLRVLRHAGIPRAGRADGRGRAPSIPFSPPGATGRCTYGPLQAGRLHRNVSVRAGRRPQGCSRPPIPRWTPRPLLRMVHRGMEIPYADALADVDGDNAVTAMDADLILQRSLGLVSTFEREGAACGGSRAGVLHVQRRISAAACDIRATRSRAISRATGP